MTPPDFSLTGITSTTSLKVGTVNGSGRFLEGTIVPVPPVNMSGRDHQKGDPFLSHLSFPGIRSSVHLPFDENGLSTLGTETQDHRPLTG